MTRLHELIDRENPSCLYCKSNCDIKQDGFFLAGTLTLFYELQILTCQKCKEIFEIHWLDDNGETRMIGFTFTCKKIVVYNHYDKNEFTIGGKELLYKNWGPGLNSVGGNIVPEFTVDFSNKRKLNNKLKTYLVFS